MKCIMCEKHQIGITFKSGNLLCFICITDIRNGALSISAPYPLVEA